MKAVCCQIDSSKGDTESNINRIEKSLEIYSEKDQLDIILFPELAFTGYFYLLKGYLFKDK